MTTTHTQTLTNEITAALDAGELTPGQVVGLTDEEAEAIAEVARRLRRSGRASQAARLFGLLTAYLPYHAGYWCELAHTKRALGQNALAVACFEFGALLGPRRAEDAQAESCSLHSLGRDDLARGVKKLIES